MEPVAFLMFTLVFWAASFICILIAFSVFKRKQFRNKMLVISLVNFLIPCLFFIGVKIRNEIKRTNFTGQYITAKPSYPTVEVKILENNTFQIIFENCPKNKVEGTWKYIEDFDGFIFKAEGEKHISVTEDYQGKIFIESEILADCYRIDYLELIQVDD